MVRTICTLGWKEKPTLYAVVVRGLDFRQDYLSRKGPEDGHPTKDDYDIGSKLSNEASLSAKCGLTCVPKKPVPVTSLTLPHLSHLCHIEHANAEANIVEDAIRVFLDEGPFWGETEGRVTRCTLVQNGPIPPFYLANIRYNDINSSLTVRFRELRGLRNNRFTRFTQKLLIMRE